MVVILDGRTRVRKMDLDLGVVGHQMVAEPAAGPVVQPEPQLGHAAPLCAGPLDAVHVDQVGNALEPNRRKTRPCCSPGSSISLRAA